MNYAITIDVEPDIHTGTFKGVTEGIPTLLAILDKHNIKATFFTTCDCIEHTPELFKKLNQEGHEIALHGYRHVRYEQLSLKEKQEHFSKAQTLFTKTLGTKARGFRAPQHSIDEETLALLEQYGFQYDSSRTPLNILQLIFFPKHWKEWKKDQTKNKPYLIRPTLLEIPTSSMIIPFVSLTLRVLPKPLLTLYLWILKKISNPLVYYAHSWDFIALPQSKIDRTFSHTKHLNKLDFVITSLNKTHQAIRLEDWQ